MDSCKDNDCANADFFQENWHITEKKESRFTYAEYGAYSLEWPIFAFADSFGNIFIYNAYKNYII